MTSERGDTKRDALASLAAAGEHIALRGGEVLFQQGAAGDAMYVLLSGRLRILVNSPSGPVPVGTVAPGETVGEMALLVGEPRSATVVAARDCRLVRVSPESFAAATQAEPEALLALMRELVHRLQRANRGGPRRAPPATIAILEGAAGPELPDFAASLRLALRRHGSTGLIAAAEADGHRDEELAARLDRLEAENRFVIYQADGGADWRAHCLRQADLVLILDGDRVVERHQGVEARHLVRPGRPADLERLARLIAGEAVGLVLGGGGARGFAHLGVLRALRELAIPIDAVAGVSMGSILGGLVALELELEEIVELCRRWIVAADLLGEKQLPLLAAVNPRRFDHSLAALFAEQRIEDLPLRYFCVSANLTEAELIVHDSGLLRDAVRASTRLPGVFPPVARQGDLLVDGGVLDNLPGDVMRGRVPCRVIASDVSPRRDLAVDPSLTELPANRELLLHRHHEHVPGLAQILVRTLMLGSLHSTHQVARDADVYLHPPTDSFGIFEFDAIDRLIEAGYEHALPRLAAWKESGVAV